MAIDAPPAQLATERDIETCYRLLLGREPDPGGFAAWRDFISTRLVTTHDLVRHFLESREYGNRSLRTIVQYGRYFLVPAGDDVYAEGIDYEPHVYAPLMEAIRPGETFVDAGANIGLFSVFAAAKGARVIAIEPQPQNARLILANAQNNGVCVELHPVALSDKTGYALMGAAPQSSNASIAGRFDPLDAHVVPTARLEALINEPIHVLKIDVEGFEYKALLGGRELLARHKPVLFTEYSPEYQKYAESDGESYLEYLLGFGYRITVLNRHRRAELAHGIDDVRRHWEAAVSRGIGHLDLMLTE